MGLGEASILGCPSHCVCPSSASFAAAVALAAATAEASWAHDTLAGIADAGVVLPDGTELFIGSITFAAAGPALTLPNEAGTPRSSPRWPKSTRRCWLALLQASRQIADWRSNYISIRVRTPCRVRAQ